MRGDRAAATIGRMRPASHAFSSPRARARRPSTRTQRGLLAAWLVILGACAEEPRDAGIRLAGIVTDGEAPVASVVVTVASEDQRQARATSDGDGRFRFEGLTAGTYAVRFEHPDYMPTRLEALSLERDLEDLEAVLVPETAPRLLLGGRIFGEDGQGSRPLVGAEVALHVAGAASATGARAHQTSTTDGSFEFEVGAGTYEIRVTAAGFASFASAPLVVTTESVEGLSFTLTAIVVPDTYTVRGTVRSSEGPLTGVSVTLRRGATAPSVVVATTQSDSAGAFFFANQAPDTYDLQFVRGGYVDGSIAPFALTDDRTDLEVVLEAAPVTRFRFAIQSDMHIYKSGAIAPGLKQIVRGTIEHVRPTFVIFSGDLTSGTTGTDEVDVIEHYWDRFFEAIAGYLPAAVYYFPARGNHDQYTAEQRAAWTERWHDHRVPGITIDGDPAGYYAFDFGNAHFTILAGHAVGLGTTQMDWLERDLAAAQGMAHRFVVSHIPFIAKMGSHGHGTISGKTSGGKRLEDVLVGGKIDALFVGHEHVYDDDATSVPGVRQVMCGTAAGTYTFPFADGTTQELTASMVVVDVDGGTVAIHGVRDAPKFSTTWQGKPIAAPPPRALPGPVAPVADILVVDGWQRGGPAARAEMRGKALAMFAGLTRGGAALDVAIVDQAAVASGGVALESYAMVAYFLGNESSDDASLTTREQELLAAYVEAGGKLLVSGSEVGYELAGKHAGETFFAEVLGATYVSDDAGSGAIAGVAGTAFAGIASDFDQGADPWKYPDVIGARANATALLMYGTGGTGSIAAVGWTAGGSGVVYVAFALDGVTDADARHALAVAATRYLLGE